MKYILILIISLIQLFALAQEHPIAHAKYERDIFQRFDNFTVKNGLPSNTIRRIFQDKEGYLWLATDNGLSRYDGNGFTNFLPIKGDSTSISNQEITSIAQTADGYLWIGTKDGLNRLDTKTGRFQRFNTSNSPFVRDNYIRALLVCSDGYLWYDSANATLTRLDPATFKFRHFIRQEVAFTVYFNHALFETSDRKIWVGSYGTPLYVYDKSRNIIEKYVEKTDKTYRGINPAAGAYDDQQDYLWIANFAHHATIINKKTNSKTPLFKHNGINCIVPDLSGNVWFGGCYSVLNKYDPVTNTVNYYEHDDNNPQSRLGGQIYTILCDRTGVIWIGTDKGLSRLSPYKYKFPLYRTIPGFASPKSNNIKSIFQDRDGDIWFGTADSAVFCFNPRTKAYQLFRHDRKNPQTIASRDVTGIAQESDGTLWFSLFTAIGGAINSFDKQSGKFTRYDTSDKYYWYSDINIHNDTILVGSWGTGAMYFDKKLGDYSTAFSRFSKGFTQSSWDYHRLAADKDGNVWFYSGFVKFSSYNTKNQEFSTYISQYESDFGSFNNLIMNKIKPITLPVHHTTYPALLHRDHHGTVWEVGSKLIAELNKEVNRFAEYKIPFEINPKATCNSISNNGLWLGGSGQLLHFSMDNHLFTTYKANPEMGKITKIAEISKNKLLVSNAHETYLAFVDKTKQAVSFQKVDSLSFDVSQRLNNGNILLGSSHGLYVFKPEENKLVKIEGEAENVVAHSMSSLDGKSVYIGSDNGLLLFDQEIGITNWWKANPNDINQLNSKVVYSVSLTVDGTVWIATDLGYSKLNPDHTTFTNYTNTLKDALTNTLVSVVFADSKGYTWIGTTSSYGLNRLKNNSGQIDNYRFFAPDSASIASGDINSVFESADHSIWIGTSTGLCKFIPASNNFRRYNTRQGFESSDIRSIEEDRSGNLWLGTASGLTRFNPTTGNCVNFSWKDGLQPGVFNNKSATRLKNGELVFGGDDGYNMFRPEAIRLNPTLPYPLITAININDSCRYLSYPKELKLKYDERNIEFRVSSSDFNFPENNKLEYKLEGFDRDFRTGLHGASAVYTNLRPGTYRFILRVTNNDGIWSSTPLVIPMKIAYPFWLQWWAVVLEIALLSGIVVWIVRANSRRILLKNKSLEKEVAIQTERLHLQKEEIATQHQMVAKQKEHIQKLYNQLTDNVEYARSIQHSFQFTSPQRTQILGRSFVISQPLNQLSGDFIWIHHDPNPLFILADCSLNGIPGALVSMVYVSLLKEIFKSSTSVSPAEILNTLEIRLSGNEIGSLLNKPLFSNSAIGIGILDRSKMEITYAGKGIDLFIARNENSEPNLQIAKGTAHLPDTGETANTYSDVSIGLKPGNFLYLFTDGLTKLFTTSEEEIKTASKSLEELVLQNSKNNIDLQESLFLNQICELKKRSHPEDDLTILCIEV